MPLMFWMEHPNESDQQEHAAVHGTMILKLFLNQSEGINMIHIALDGDQLWALVNMVVNDI
jgi:hypothetical protein